MSNDTKEAARIIGSALVALGVLYAIAVLVLA